MVEKYLVIDVFTSENTHTYCTDASHMLSDFKRGDMLCFERTQMTGYEVIPLHAVERVYLYYVAKEDIGHVFRATHVKPSSIDLL